MSRKLLAVLAAFCVALGVFMLVNRSPAHLRNAGKYGVETGLAPCPWNYPWNYRNFAACSKSQ